jgi:hypothetical protein
MFVTQLLSGAHVRHTAASGAHVRPHRAYHILGTYYILTVTLGARFGVRTPLQVQH